MLSWPAASDPSGIVRYDVYRGATLIGSSPTTSFTDSALATDGSYAYTVVAVDGAGNRALASAPTTVVFDHTPPPAPSIPQASTPTGVLPSLVWASGGADALSGFDHYVVYRDGVAVGTPTSPAFVDADLATLGPHLYVIRAVDAAGQHLGPVPGPDGHLRHPAAADAHGSHGLVADERAEPHVDGLERRQHGRVGRRRLPRVPRRAADRHADVAELRRRIALDLGLARLLGHGGGRRRKREPGLADAGRRRRSRPAAGAARPERGSPTQRPSLNWGAATDVGPGTIAIDHYNVYREGTLIARTTTTNFVDTRVTTSGQVSYTVRAVDLAGNVGPPSTPVSVTIDVTGPTPPEPRRSPASAPSARR